LGVEPGPTVGDGSGSDGFAGVAVGAGVGVGSDGSTGVGVILGSTGLGEGVGVPSIWFVGFGAGVMSGSGVAGGVGVGMPVARYSFEIVVAIIPEIRNKSVVIARTVFLNIMPPFSLAFTFRLRRAVEAVCTTGHTDDFFRNTL